MDKTFAENLSESFFKEIDEIKINLKALNLMVIGKTGVGKSTLINSMFGETLAPTGKGRPVTFEPAVYKSDKYPFTVMDWPGFELDGDNSCDSLFKAIKAEIARRAKKNNPNEMVHCILYCINASSHRFEETEKNIILSLADSAKKYNVPIIIVLTQSYQKKDSQALKEQIEAENIPCAGVVRVLAQEKNFDEYTKAAYGLEELVVYISRLLEDEQLRETLECVQKVNARMTEKHSLNVVYGAATSAASLGAMPIFNNKKLVPIAAKMLAKITLMYDVDVNPEFIDRIAASLGDEDFIKVHQAGALKFLKFIEPVTYAVNSANLGVQLSGIIASVGEAYIEVMKRVSTGEVKDGDYLIMGAVMAASLQGKKRIKRNLVGKPVEKYTKMGNADDKNTAEESSSDNDGNNSDASGFNSDSEENNLKNGGEDDDI